MEVQTALPFMKLFTLEFFRYFWAKPEQVSIEETSITHYFVTFTISVYLGQ